MEIGKTVLTPEEGQLAQSVLSPSVVEFETRLQSLLSQTRNVQPGDLILDPAKSADSIPASLTRYISALTQSGKPAEAEALQQVYDKVVDSPNFGGLGLIEGVKATAHQHAEAIFLVEAWLDAITSRQRERDYRSFLKTPATGTKPMTLAEKIFAQHVIGEMPPHGLKAGDVVRVGIDWILASELSWQVCSSGTLCDHSMLISSREWPGRIKNWDLLAFGETTVSGWLVTMFTIQL